MLAVTTFIMLVSIESKSEAECQVVYFNTVYDPWLDECTGIQGHGCTWVETIGDCPAGTPGDEGFQP